MAMEEEKYGRSQKTHLFIEAVSFYAIVSGAAPGFYFS